MLIVPPGALPGLLGEVPASPPCSGSCSGPCSGVSDVVVEGLPDVLPPHERHFPVEIDAGPIVNGRLGGGHVAILHRPKTQRPKPRINLPVRPLKQINNPDQKHQTKVQLTIRLILSYNSRPTISPTIPS